MDKDIINKCDLLSDDVIKKNYTHIVSNYISLFDNMKWEKCGENFKQFSLYDNNYNTEILTKIK